MVLTNNLGEFTMTFKRSLPLFMIVFISFFCYSSMLTMFVPMLQDSSSPMFLSHLTSANRNILSGIFLSLYPLGQFLGSPIIGILSDRLGRKKMLIMSLSISSLCILTIAYAIFAKSLILLAVACLVAGLGESNMSLALSAFSDMSTTEQRGKYFAYAWVMCSMGYIFGSVFGGVASVIGYVNPFIIEAIMILAVIGTTTVLFAETVQKSQHKLRIKNTLLAFFSVFENSPLRIYYLTNFIFYLAFFGVLRVELLYMQDVFKLTQAQIALFYAYASVIAMFANFVVTPRLLKRYTVRTVFIMSAVASIFSSIMFILPNNPNSLYITTALIGFCIPVLTAMSGALISEQAQSHNHGAVMGNNQSLQVIAEALSAAAGGFLFAISASAPFLLFALLGIFASIILVKFCKKA